VSIYAGFPKSARKVGSVGDAEFSDVYDWCFGSPKRDYDCGEAIFRALRMFFANGGCNSDAKNCQK
jgi:hypothetical protein